MIKLLCNKRGVTLIELLVVLAIICIVIVLAFSFNVFGIKTFDLGRSQSNTQHNVRMAASYITEEIRYANAVEILSEMPETRDSGKKYFFVDGNTIKYCIDIDEKELFHETSSDFTPKLTFKKNSNNKILNVTISGTYKGQSFSIASEVLIMNLNPSDGIIGDTGSILAFSSP